MRRSDFHYELPPELIAQHPLERRSDSRLLCLDGTSGALSDRRFADLVELVRPGDLLVFNDTRVIPARLAARKTSGGVVEILVERLLGGGEVLAHVRASKSPKPGSELEIEGDGCATVIAREADLFRLRFDTDDVLGLLERAGHVPLPPYVERPDDNADRERYQTVYARTPGAVAAPTAGLHFDEEVLEMLARKGVAQAFVTLHVGAGTFQPVREEQVEDHHMHSEYVDVSEKACAEVAAARARGGRVIAVGTTAVRCLETAAAGGVIAPYRGDTALFIYPGYRFRAVDAMITNFHLPESTLLMLVSAFAGRERVLAAYAHAVAERYRFFSYGDAMFILPQEPAG